MKNKQLPFHLIILAIFLLIAGPALFSDGMFMDGLLYAVVSNNLANNMGSFWDLHLTETLYPHFHEHPPLAFGIQSLWFRLFGDSLLVERIYSLTTFLLTGWIIIRIWNTLPGFKNSLASWAPLLIWISFPLITWSAANNMLENTMMIFTCLSILFYLKSLKNNRFPYVVLSGLVLFFAFLTKGPTALFPLSFPFWILVFNRSIGFKRFLVDMLCMSLAMVLPMLLLFFIIPQSYDSLQAYYTSQIVRSAGVETVNSRIYILWRLLKELVPSILLILSAYLFTRKHADWTKRSSWTWVFLALSLSGVIPIMISLKQSGFYIVPAIVFLSIAIAILISPGIANLVKRLQASTRGFRIFWTFSIVLFITSISIAFLQLNRIDREKNLINDVYSIVDIVPDNTTISVQNELWFNWYLHGYLARYGGISIEEIQKFDHQYLLLKKGFKEKTTLNYQLIPCDLELYDLYEKLPQH